MDEHRCQLCGRRIKPRIRAVFLAGAPGSDRPALVSEPPLHRACAAYAIQVCPHLVPGHRNGSLSVAEAEEYLLLEERVRPSSPDPTAGLLAKVCARGSEEARAFGALQTLLAVLPGPWTPASQWLERHCTTA
ncbi:hypothetical protein ACIQOV_29405 [Kitasatospora sp. NPDC091257]|uniref:hypothetical protein n=1 Tax=unclassified Kitasatospora TaxID=2633591 RepID=UPI002F91B8BF